MTFVTAQKASIVQQPKPHRRHRSCHRELQLKLHIGADPSSYLMLSLEDGYSIAQTLAKIKCNVFQSFIVHGRLPARAVFLIPKFSADQATINSIDGEDNRFLQRNVNSIISE